MRRYQRRVRHRARRLLHYFRSLRGGRIGGLNLVHPPNGSEVTKYACLFVRVEMVLTDVDILQRYLFNNGESAALHNQ